MAKTILESFQTLKSNLEITGLQSSIVSTRQQNVRDAFKSEEPCGRDHRASKSKFKQPELFKVFFSNNSKYIGTAAETAGCINYKVDAEKNRDK